MSLPANFTPEGIAAARNAQQQVDNQINMMMKNLNLPGYTGQSGGSYGTDYLGQAANTASSLQNLGVNTGQTSGGGFGQFLTGAGNVLGDIFGGVQQIGSAISPAMPAIAGSLLTKEAYDRLSNVGDTAYQRSMDLAERGQQESQFKPFTVTTPTGSAFTARMGGQPQPPMMTGGPVAPPPGIMPIAPPSMVLPGQGTRGRPGITPNPLAPPMMTGGPVPPPSGLMPFPMTRPITYGNETTDRMKRENPPQLIQPVTGGPVSPGFTPVLRPMLGTSQPGIVMDADVTFGSGQGRPAGMPRFAGSPDSQPAADAMARQYQQPAPQPQGGLEIGMSLSPEEQSMYEGLFGGAGQFFGQAQQPTAGREQEIFNRMRAAQMPEEQRQRLALEERLAAQGRLGTSSAAYGGATPEMLAMATAQEEGRNRAMLGAMQQAQAEQMQQASLGQQFLGSSYLPQQQLLAALQPGLTQQQMAQQAQQFGTGLFGETALSGIEAQLLAEQARANLLGGVGSNILAGMFTPQVNQRTGDVTSPGGFGDLGGLFGGIGEGLGSIGRAIGIID